MAIVDKAKWALIRRPELTASGQHEIIATAQTKRELEGFKHMYYRRARGLIMVRKDKS